MTSRYMDPWGHSKSPGRLFLSPVHEDSDVARVPTPFRAEAPPFHPGGNGRPGLSANTFVEPPESPIYELQTKTFVPPTPTLPPTPELESWGKPTPVTSPPESYYTPHKPASSKSDSSDFHDPRSIWSNQHGNLPRSDSDVFSNATGFPSMYDTPSRPRSRSDAPMQSARPDWTFDASASATPSETSSQLSSTHIPVGIISPSPLRKIYPYQSVNEQTWSRSPVPEGAGSNTFHRSSGSSERRNHPQQAGMLQQQQNTTNVHLSRSQEHRDSTLHRLSMVPQQHDHNAQAQSMHSGHMSRQKHGTMAQQHTFHAQGPQMQAAPMQQPVGRPWPRQDFQQDDSGRETPGGVPLPRDMMTSEPSFVDQFNRLHVSNASQQQYHQNAHRLPAPRGHDYYNSPESYASTPVSYSGDASSVIARSSSPSAKSLAEFIRSGGAEPVSARGQSTQNTPRAQAAVMHGTPPWARTPIPLMPTGLPAMPMQKHITAQQMIAPPHPLVEQWKQQGGPFWQEIVSHMPFVERTQAVSYGNSNHGVIKFVDIPFNATKPEIVAVLGEKARMVSMPNGAGTYAIHIMMERTTAKSNDCYVELETPQEAASVAARLQNGRRLVGNRRARVELSSQEALMHELFPRAKCVQWIGCEPQVLESKDEYLSGFQGFVNSEEMYAMSRIAQNPQRYQFTNKHPQRTYEATITLLFKYPWRQTELYTLGERDRIFKTVSEQMVALIERLRRHGSSAPIDVALLYELLHAGLKCPGFSEKQRAELIDRSEGCCKVDVYVTAVANEWPAEAVGFKEGAAPGIELYMFQLLHAGANAVARTSATAMTPSALPAHKHQNNSSTATSAIGATNYYNQDQNRNKNQNQNYDQNLNQSETYNHQSQAYNQNQGQAYNQNQGQMHNQNQGQTHKNPYPTFQNPALAQASRMQHQHQHQHQQRGPSMTRQADVPAVDKGFTIEYPQGKEKMSMKAIAEVEWAAMERALKGIVRTG